MLAHKVGFLSLFVAPWIMALLLFSPGQPAAARSGGELAAAAIASPTATEEPKPAITSPGPGEALQGMVEVTGITDVSGFRRVEIAFAYQSDKTGTWFLLQQGSDRLKDGTLARWDTTMITDGTYRLRMRVFLQDGQVLDSVLDGLRVRNYTVIETSTPEVRPAGKATSTPTATPRADFRPETAESTPLPTNPAQVTAQHLQSSALRGVLVIFGAALLGLLYAGLRAVIRR
jgi:hypothetical protein